jgi:hypothetical protein
LTTQWSDPGTVNPRAIENCVRGRHQFLAACAAQHDAKRMIGPGLVSAQVLAGKTFSKGALARDR